MVASASAVFDGPVELVKAIFDTAAQEERSTALKLIRVCKAAREWISPILYDTVELDNPSALRFETMLKMPSSSSLAPLIRSLRVSCLPNVALLSSCCREVRAMTISNYDILHLDQLTLPSLRYLTVGGSLRYSHFSSNMTALATITHLRFPNDVPRLPDDFALAIPNLTHFSCCYQLSKKSQQRELEECLSTVIAAPALRTVVVYVHTFEQKAENLVADIIGVRDPRIVVASRVELPDEWQNLSPTYNSSWSFADNKLNTRSSCEPRLL